MNFMFSILGWALWNWGELELKKRELDEDGNPQTNFSFADFRKQKWTSWIGSLLCCFFLLIVGYKQLGLKPFASIIGDHEWTDAYYAGAGIAWEALLFTVVQIKNRFKK